MRAGALWAELVLAAAAPLAAAFVVAGFLVAARLVAGFVAVGFVVAELAARVLAVGLATEGFAEADLALLVPDVAALGASPVVRVFASVAGFLAVAAVCLAGVDLPVAFVLELAWREVAVLVAVGLAAAGFAALRRVAAGFVADGFAVAVRACADLVAVDRLAVFPVVCLAAVAAVFVPDRLAAGLLVPAAAVLVRAAGLLAVVDLGDEDLAFGAGFPAAAAFEAADFCVAGFRAAGLAAAVFAPEPIEAGFLRVVGLRGAFAVVGFLAPLLVSSVISMLRYCSRHRMNAAVESETMRRISN